MSLGDIAGELALMELLVTEQYDSAVRVVEYIGDDLLPQVQRLTAGSANPDAATLLGAAEAAREAAGELVFALGLWRGAIGVWRMHL